MLKDCPLLQKVGERRKFKRKENKKAMIAVWSDSESSESDNYEEHVINTCLMAKDMQEEEQSEYGSTDEVDISSLYDCSKDELIDALISFAKLEEKYMSKYKELKKRVRELCKKNVDLGKLNNDLQVKVKDLEAKNIELSTKCDVNHTTILKFTQGQENLDKILSTQRTSFYK